MMPRIDWNSARYEKHATVTTSGIADKYQYNNNQSNNQATSIVFINLS